MSIIELLKIEFMKVKRSMILPLLLIPPIVDCFCNQYLASCRCGEQKCQY